MADVGRDHLIDRIAVGGITRERAGELVSAHEARLAAMSPEERARHRGIFAYSTLGSAIAKDLIPGGVSFPLEYPS